MPRAGREGIQNRLMVFSLLLVALPASAQVDLSGQWGRVAGDNIRSMGNAGTGDYTGIPYNDAGRLRSDTWNATVLSQRERQAQPHNGQYHMFYPARSAFFENIVDPVTKKLIGYEACCHGGSVGRTIWLDGRAHPPEFAERDW